MSLVVVVYLSVITCSHAKRKSINSCMGSLHIQRDFSVSVHKTQVSFTSASAPPFIPSTGLY